MQNHEVHISSLVVHTRPQHVAAISHYIDNIASAEVYGTHPNGKIVVVLETERQSYITDTIEKITGLENVLNAALVFHQIEAIDSHSKDDS